MRNSFWLCVLVLTQTLVAQNDPATPLVLAPDSPQLHLLNRTPPLYPPIARAAHVAGPVGIQVEIAPDGHIASAKVLTGPLMLRSAALDALRHWLYAPVLIEGKPVSVTTTVTIPFDLNLPSSQLASPTPKNSQDRKLAEHLRPLEEACTQALASKSSPPSSQVERCQKAADLADQLSEQGYDARRRAFIYLSTALRHDKQLPEALTAANKAVAAVQQGFEDGAQASSAYSVRAEDEAQLGKLAEASQDLTMAEESERTTIALAMTPQVNKDFDKVNQSFARTNYIPVLKALLIYHAQVLKALNRPTEAAAKIAEADKL